MDQTQTVKNFEKVNMPQPKVPTVRLRVSQKNFGDNITYLAIRKHPVIWINLTVKHDHTF